MTKTDYNGHSCTVIAIGNEKGGAGKSTTAMHLFTACTELNLVVGIVDLDTRQKSMLHYLANRRAYAAKNGVQLSDAHTRELQNSKHIDARVRDNTDAGLFRKTLSELASICDVVLIDCPGANTFFSD